MIYLDAAAAAPPDEEALAFFCQCERKFFANQEAGHRFAYEVRKELERAAEKLSAALMGTPDYPVIWENSATDLFGLLGAFLAGKKAVTSVLEHPALRAAIRRNSPCFELPCSPQGVLTGENVPFVPEAVLLHHVQSELGIVQDLETCFSPFPSALKIVDAVQAAGKIPLDRAADVTVISGVKFGAPGGAALLIHPRSACREKLLTFAGSYRSREYRASRPLPAMAMTLAFAAEKCEREREERFFRLSALRRSLWERICQLPGVSLTLPLKNTSAYFLHLTLRGRQAAVIVRALSEKGIHTASGSACAAESAQPSPALLALGYSRSDAYSGLRISFHAASTPEEVKIFAAELENALKNY